MAVKAIAALGATALLLSAAAPARADHAPPTLVEERALEELQDFTAWLTENSAEGFIGEVGWPGGDTPEADQWNHLAESWMQRADKSRLWVTAWATGEWWPDDYRLAVYTASGGGQVDTPRSQAVVLERHLAQFGRGVNVAGAEFAAPSDAPRSFFSNRNRGTYGVDYHYDSRETFTFLAQRGIGMVRLPFRWERLQPRLGQRLAKVELRRLARAVQRAGDAGLKVVLDMHNYGAYYRHRDGEGIRRPVGTPGCTTAEFADVWRRLSKRFGDDRSVVGYGLMNEPIGIPATARATPAKRWERISQRVLSAIRARGDLTTILVPGYEWSGVQSWRANHPDGWITDPAGRFRYEAHHYWDSDHSGRYALSYDEENTP